MFLEQSSDLNKNAARNSNSGVKIEQVYAGLGNEIFGGTIYFTQECLHETKNFFKFTKTYVLRLKTREPRKSEQTKRCQQAQYRGTLISIERLGSLAIPVHFR